MRILKIPGRFWKIWWCIWQIELFVNCACAFVPVFEEDVEEYGYNVDDERHHRVYHPGAGILDADAGYEVGRREER